MPSLRAKIKKLAYQKIISDNDRNRIINALDVAEQESKTDTWSIKEVADVLEKHGLLEQEPKTAYWYEDFSGLIKCSNCKYDAYMDTTSAEQCESPFCPNCGCEMLERSADSESEVSK